MKSKVTFWLIGPLLALVFLLIAGNPAETVGRDFHDSWSKSGGNLFNQNYSPLTQINRQTVTNLKAVWRTHLDGSGMGGKYSGEAQPIVNDGSHLSCDRR